jgi:hypothetical protein
MCGNVLDGNGCKTSTCCKVGDNNGAQFCPAPCEPPAPAPAPGDDAPCDPTPPSGAAVASTLRMEKSTGPAVTVDLLEDGPSVCPPTPHPASNVTPPAV